MLPDGEAYKNAETLELIYDALLAHRAERKTPLIALGGGVIGDITGFAAATLSSRRALHPDPDHSAVAGGLLGRRQDRHQPSAGQEHDRCVLPAAGGAGRHATLNTLPRQRAVCGRSPKSSSTA